jgi:hypothetical protein
MTCHKSPRRRRLISPNQPGTTSSHTETSRDNNVAAVAVDNGTPATVRPAINVASTAPVPPGVGNIDPAAVPARYTVASVSIEASPPAARTQNANAATCVTVSIAPPPMPKPQAELKPPDAVQLTPTRHRPETADQRGRYDELYGMGDANARERIRRGGAGSREVSRGNGRCAHRRWSDDADRADRELSQQRRRDAESERREPQ